MNYDLFLSILALDSYNRGYGQRVNFEENSDAAGTQIGNAAVLTQLDTSPNSTSVSVGFYAIAYSWGGETIVSYRGTDGLNDVTKGWTTAAGWASAQAQLAIEFYNAATGRDAFDVALPANVTLTGHSLGGGLAGFVSAANDNWPGRRERAA
jgi:hypothetical protein